MDREYSFSRVSICFHRFVRVGGGNEVMMLYMHVLDVPFAFVSRCFSHRIKHSFLLWFNKYNKCRWIMHGMQSWNISRVVPFLARKRHINLRTVSWLSISTTLPGLLCAIIVTRYTEVDYSIYMLVIETIHGVRLQVICGYITPCHMKRTYISIVYSGCELLRFQVTIQRPEKNRC